MNRLSIYLSIIAITALFSSAVSATTLDDVRKSSTAAKSNISSSHMVYFLESKHPRLSFENMPKLDDTSRKIAELNRNITFEVDAVIDSSLEKSKLIFTDLRDANALRTQYNLPKRTRISLPANYTILIKSNYEMDYYPPLDYEEPNNAMIVLNKHSGPANYYLDLPYYGIIDSNLLDEERQPAVSEIIQDGQKLIQINVSYKMAGGARLGVIICDPQIQYRCRSIVWTNDKGVKSTEITASDYKNVNGIPYPFSYVYRQFANGELDREESYTFQKVQFNVTLNDLDFKILVPKGTSLTDLAISNRSPVIGLERFMGIDDVLTIGRNMAQNQ
jgi:hypothetical protein